MIDESLERDAIRLSKALPMYLAVQVATLVFTALDRPVYIQAYRAGNQFAVTGWMGAWLVLVLFGLATSVFLLIRRSWCVLFQERTRARLSLGYFLGSVMGLLTLGTRFAPVIAPQYFLQVGIFALLVIAGYFLWGRREHKPEELFP